MRPDDGYWRCSPGCGCCADTYDNDQDLENSGSNFMPENEDEDDYPEDMPLDVTPGERLLWAIFGKQPPENEDTK